MTDTQHTHHAYILTGSEEEIRNTIPEMLSAQFGVEASGNPDVLEMSYDTFGIEDAHALGMHARQSAVGENGRYFICYVRGITTEAQNALLKTIEEPAEGTRFFIVVPYLEMLLETVRSRMAHLDHTQGFSNAEMEDLAREFMNAAPHERLQLMQQFISEKDKTRALSFLDYLEYTLSQTKERNDDFGELLSAIYQTKKQISQRGGSLKLSLEQLALSA